MRRAFLTTLAIVLLLSGCGGGGESDDAAASASPRFWIVGATAAGNVLLRSDDGAASWDVVSPGGQVTVAFFVDRDHGWVGGREISRTSDGGVTWERQIFESASEHPFVVRDIAFAGQDRGVAVGVLLGQFPFGSESHVIETSDGGSTWRAAPVAPSSPGSFHAACMGDRGAVLAVGGGGFNSVSSHVRAARRAADGIWDDVRELLYLSGAGSMNGALRDVACVGASELWVVGRRLNYVELPVEPLSIMHSRDGGVSWEDESTRSPVRGNAWLEAIDFAAHHGWAVGAEEIGDDDTYATRPLVLRTVDGGREWHRVSFPDDRVVELTAVDFGTSDAGLVLGVDANARRRAYVTDDGGQRWVPVALPAEITDISDVRAVR